MALLSMEPLLRKKALILATFISAYFFYVSVSIKSKRENLRNNHYVKLLNFGGPHDLMTCCEALGTVFITIEEGLGPDTYEKNAINLFNSEFGYKNVCKTRKLDLCITEKYCKTLELKNFILQYFREIERSGVILRKRLKHSINTDSYIYDINPDQEDLNKDSKKSKELREGLKVFGMMIGLAVIHKLYLEIKFERHFLVIKFVTHSHLSELLFSLKEIDPDQYELFRKVESNYGNSDEKIIKFVPKSPKPFRHLNDPDPLGIEYSKNYFPFSDAVNQIFIYPFKISRDLIFEGMKKVCSIRYYNNNRCFYENNHLVNLNEIFSSAIDELNLYDLKDNVDIDKNSKIFLRALKHLSKSELFKVYQKATGFKFMPIGGFSRLPRIKIVSGRGNQMFQKHFIIVIEPKIDDEHELAQKIRENIDISIVVST